MLSYRVTLDVPFQLVLFVSRRLAEHRREIGTRDGTRALTCWKQAVFVLAWFRDRPDIRRLGAGLGISQATAYRYEDEAVEVLAAKAPSSRIPARLPAGTVSASSASHARSGHVNRARAFGRSRSATAS